MARSESKEERRVADLLARYDVHVGRWAANRRELAARIVATGRAGLVTDEALTWRREEARRQGRTALGAALAEFFADAGWPEVLEGRARQARPQPRNAGADDPLEIALRREADLDGITVEQVRERRRLDSIVSEFLLETTGLDRATELAGDREALGAAVADYIRRHGVACGPSLEDVLEQQKRRQQERLARMRRTIPRRSAP